MISLRRATAEDVDWLVDLLTHEDTEPFLGGQRSFDAGSIRGEVERSETEPERFGRLVIEADGERAGVMGFEERSEVHRTANLGCLAVHPDFRGRGIADDAARLLQRYLLVELDFHRLQLKCYGFNERAIRHAERVGFVREGVERKAYLRHGEWQDAVLFALLREDLEHEERSRHDMTVTDRPEELRYEIEVDGEIAGFMAYRRAPGLVDLVHTDVAPKWEGKSVGAELVKGALDDLRARALKVRATCPFVAAYIRRHPEYGDLVAP